MGHFLKISSSQNECNKVITSIIYILDQSKNVQIKATQSSSVKCWILVRKALLLTMLKSIID